MNFVTILYKHSFIESRSIYTSFYPKEEDYSFFYYNLIRQIKNLYPHSKIHVLTNMNLYKEKNTFFYDINFDLNHFIKLEIFDFLKESFIFLDCDILLIKRFDYCHLNTKNDFNLFSMTKFYDLGSLSGLGSFNSIHYNNGVIWVKKPSFELKKELIKIKNDHLSNLNNFIKYKEYYYNDEHVTNLFIHKNKLKMKLFHEVNYFRNKIKKKKEILNFQSVHYHQNSKYKLKEDLKYFKIL